jgi:hypothetical protein
LILGPGARVDTGNACLINNSDMKIVEKKDLAREAGALIEIGLCREDSGLVVADGARVAGKDLDPAGRAAGIAATAVKYVDAGILDREDQPFLFVSLKSNGASGSFCLDIYHQISPLSFL